MKAFKLLAGTIGSTAAWYILSNKKLREELGKAGSPEETMKILSQYLGRDASKISTSVHEFMHSGEIQETLGKAKEISGQKIDSAKKGIGGLLSKGLKAVKGKKDSEQ